MKTSIHDGKLFLVAEDESDNSLLYDIWTHPLVIEYTKHARKFMDGKGFLPNEIITSEPKRIDVEIEE